MESVQTIIDLLQLRSVEAGPDGGYLFLEDGEAETALLDYSELWERSRAIGVDLQARHAQGSRILLVFPSGLDYIQAFFGCIAGGMVPVPTYPPDPTRLERSLPRFVGLLRDAQPAEILASTAVLDAFEPLAQLLPEIAAVPASDPARVASARAAEWRRPERGPDSLAFLQYTSGSTGDPKGVMVSHRNLLSHSAALQEALKLDSESTGVMWLPLYHDMGLIGAIVATLWLGSRCVVMPPTAFLRRPMRWLRAISRYRASWSGGPNFGYELCVRRLASDPAPDLDLSSWRAAVNGAEPIAPGTLERFARTFEASGFEASVMTPAWGLAEATLGVTLEPRTEEPRTIALEAAALEQHRVVLAEGPEGDGSSRQLVGCGRPLGDQTVAVVDPETLARKGAGEVGELWVEGSHVALGFWGRPALSEEIFGARIAEEDGTRYLRTGDLGFVHEGRIFVTGRRKDLLIVRGRNHYPQDIERSAERAHPAARPGCSAAFSVLGERGELPVLVQEVRLEGRHEPTEITDAIRSAVAEAHDLALHAVVLIEPRTIPKTSSGKIQRRSAAEAFSGGSLRIVAEDIDVERPPEQAPSSALAAMLLAISSDQRPGAIEAFLRQEVTAVSGRPAADMARGAPLDSLGLDSLMLVELQARIEDGIGIQIDQAALLAQELTLSRLTAVIGETLTSAPAR